MKDGSKIENLYIKNDCLQHKIFDSDFLTPIFFAIVLNRQNFNDEFFSDLTFRRFLVLLIFEYLLQVFADSDFFDLGGLRFSKESSTDQKWHLGFAPQHVLQGCLRQVKCWLHEKYSTDQKWHLGFAPQHVLHG